MDFYRKALNAAAYTWREMRDIFRPGNDPKDRRMSRRDKRRARQQERRDIEAERPGPTSVPDLYRAHFLHSDVDRNPWD